MAPIYLMAAILYAVGAVLLAVFDQRGVWLAGAAVQLLVVGAWLWNGLHGVWNDTAWAIVISAVEMALLGVLLFLSQGLRHGSDKPGPRGPVP